MKFYVGVFFAPIDKKITKEVSSNLLLEHIIMFYKIAAEKSISKVAQTNHISQPALSQQMQRLESFLSVPTGESSSPQLVKSSKNMRFSLWGYTAI